MTIYTDQEIRHMAISLLTVPTARDGQTRIGASNLSNGCDFCLASNFLGDDRSTPITDQAWMGKTWGTAQHNTLQASVDQATNFDGLEGDALETARRMCAEMLGLDPDAKAEFHVFFCDIEGYGRVGGTIDLLLLKQLVDWKSTTRKKLCILLDYMAIEAGNEAPYGRLNAWVKLSEKEYAKAIEEMKYKVHGYYGQQTLYMHGAGVKRASLVMLCRDGTGMFDNPAGSRYSDPKAVHDVSVVSFDYDEAYAHALINRGAAIWAHLEAGGTPADFDHHALCFPCGQDAKDAIKAAQDINIEATFPAAVAA